MMPAVNEPIISRDAIRQYVELLFRNADFGSDRLIALLGVGEKGTPAEGVLRERKFVVGSNPFAVDSILGHAQRWGQHSGGTFIVPAIVSPQAGADGDVRLDKVEALTAIVVDLDTGDTDAAAAHAQAHLGPASFTVFSGGETADGKAKRHLYWLLSEPESDVEHVAGLRKQLAAKCGGDQSFGRATQVIRVPGTVYGKGGVQKPVTLSIGSGADYHLPDLEEAIIDMPYMAGCEPSNVVSMLPRLMGDGVLDFSAAAGWNGTGRSLDETLNGVIAEGGDTDRNRWTEFSRVAGFEISLARHGRKSIEEAAQHTYGWMLGHMDPPWPEQRFATEWHAMLKLDMERHGPLPVAVALQVEPMLPVVQANERINTPEDLLSWAVIRRSNREPKQRRDLVENMIVAGQRHVFVAEGGAGKTFLMMDLFLKLAAAGNVSEDLYWLGQRVTDEAKDGTVILFTAEDGVEALDRRWAKIDPDMRLREAAGDRLIVVPFENVGGTFAFAGRNPITGQVEATPQWRHMMNQVIALSNAGRKITAVAVDTFNATHHANENDALEIAQYMRAITPITGEIGAAFMFTHHVKKAGTEPIRTKEDMLGAIRGSSAIKDNVRVAIGIWPSPDWRKEMRALGMQPRDKALFKAAVVKANEPLFDGIKTLVKNPVTSLLEDASMRLAAAAGANGERKAWLIFCIEWYADRGVFMTLSSRTTGLYTQRHRLHPLLAGMSSREFQALGQELLDDGRLTQRSVLGLGHSLQWLDVKGKKRRTRGEPGSEPETPIWDDFVFEPTSGRIVALAPKL